MYNRIKVTNKEDLTIIKVICTSCEKEFELVVKTVDWYKFRLYKELIQVCFPYLTVGERELLISGTCNECWCNLYPDEEDESE